ncbi:PD-(D/E)XK nuclease family protein [Neorhodopirellula pilleata]|uniref:PD-(D/E)XK nuclease family protein n=1 Tax=Neorhodopirellula pilleata TaxID=2714738 RepID=UPI0011B434C1|nr:PD-(D/E)XK nuclease family protein [Neorhodopirellula pilleata]
MVERVFCGWSEPLLSHAAEWLLRYRPASPSTDQPLFDGIDTGESDGVDASAGAVDLSGFDVVLPSSRAVDRLREKLVTIASESNQAYLPPRFYLVGRLPSLLYRRPAEWATDFEQTLAWARVLANSDPERLQTLVPTPPDADATAGWLDLAATARRLQSSLAAENVSFHQVLRRTEGTAERNRWELLVEAQANYLAELDNAERCDPNLAAMQAITEKRCRALRPIVLIGTADLSELVKAMMRDVKMPVTSLVAAPDEESHRFDEFGCLIPDAWKDHVLPISDDQLIAADSVDDQSQAVTEMLADYGTDHSTDQITIGVTDESQVAPIENRCRLLGVATYRHLGYTASQTAIGRLMDLVVAYQNRRTWRSLAALVRHADVYQMIDREFAKNAEDGNHHVDWLTRLDQLLSEAFPQSVDADLPGERKESGSADQVLGIVEAWLTPLNQKRRRIGKWSRILADVLQALYQDVPVCADETGATRTRLATKATCELLHQYEKLSTKLDTPVDSLTALEMLATRIAVVPLPGDPSPDKVNILGWLDLTLDDAPALVVCGLNHPFVPEAASGDPFLPASLQSKLSQRNNERRYARDVHAMHQMLTTRSAVHFIVGKRSADESPTPPSRLLAAAIADDAARRVCRLLTTSRPRIEVVSGDAIDVAGSATTTVSPLPGYFNSPPPPEPGRTVDVLSVTAFSAYLACPYRFYLRHVLKLRPLDDAALELAANQFGDLVHGALENFGDGPDKDEPDPDKIAKALIENLHRYAKKHYGDNTQAAIAIQVRQAERRLKVVAQRQAERIAQGWRIHAVEDSVDELDYDRKKKKPKKPTGILLDGKFTGLRGRFDRIDHHPETGRWAILDYKTHGHSPEKKHLKTAPDGSTRWIDLQLPLYRRFIPDLGISADPQDVELGYFNVAEKDTETKINLASFTESQFEAADELIHWCVRQIRECRFEPNPDGVQYDDYDMMFNDAGYGGSVVPDEEMEVMS